MGSGNLLVDELNMTRPRTVTFAASFPLYPQARRTTSVLSAPVGVPDARLAAGDAM